MFLYKYTGYWAGGGNIKMEWKNEFEFGQQNDRRTEHMSGRYWKKLHQVKLRVCFIE